MNKEDISEDINEEIATRLTALVSAFDAEPNFRAAVELQASLVVLQLFLGRAEFFRSPYASALFRAETYLNLYRAKEKWQRVENAIAKLKTAVDRLPGGGEQK